MQGRERQQQQQISRLRSLLPKSDFTSALFNYYVVLLEEFVASFETRNNYQTSKFRIYQDSVYSAVFNITISIVRVSIWQP